MTKNVNVANCKKKLELILVLSMGSFLDKAKVFQNKDTALNLFSEPRRLHLRMWAFEWTLRKAHLFVHLRYKLPIDKQLLPLWSQE
jgi:hypothetical protein